MQGASVYQQIQGSILRVIRKEPGRTEQEIIDFVWRDCGRFHVQGIRQVLTACVAGKLVYRRQDWYFLPNQLQVRGVLASKMADIYVQTEEFVPIWNDTVQQVTCQVQGLRVGQKLALWERCGEDFTGRHILAIVGATSVTHSGQWKTVVWLKDIQKVDDDELSGTTQASGDSQLQVGNNAYEGTTTCSRHL